MSADHNISTGKRVKTERIDVDCSDARAVCPRLPNKADVDEVMNVFVNDCREPSELKQYLFELRPEEPIGKYVSRRLMILMIQKKAVFTGMCPGSFEGMVGPASKSDLLKAQGKFKAADELNANVEDEDEMDEGEEDEKGQAELFEEYLKHKMEWVNEWPRPGCRHKELATVKWTINYYEP